MKINKVVLCVKNLDESIKFYTEAFGFKLVKRMPTGIGENALLKSDDLVMTLIVSPKLPIGIVSIGCDIDGDINAAFDELKAKGAKPVMEPQKLGLGYLAKVFDPNGISVEVMSYNVDGVDSGDRLTHLPHKEKQN